MFVYSGLKGLFMLCGGCQHIIVVVCSLRLERENEGGGGRGVIPNVGPVSEDVLVEVSPGDFGDPAYDAEVPLVELFGAVDVSGASDGCAGGQGAGSEVHTCAGGAVCSGEVARIFVLADLLVEEHLKSGMGFLLACGPHTVEPSLLFIAEFLILRRLWNRAFKYSFEFLPCTVRIPAGALVGVELMWMLVDVRNPGSKPWAVDCILPALLTR